MEAQVDLLLAKMKNIMRELGYVEIMVRDLECFKWKNDYYVLSYDRGFHSLVIECGNGIEEVEKNIMEDGELYPIDMGEEKLLKVFKEDLFKYFMD